MTVALGDSGKAQYWLLMSGVPGGTGGWGTRSGWRYWPDVPGGPGPGILSLSPTRPHGRPRDSCRPICVWGTVSPPCPPGEETGRHLVSLRRPPLPGALGRLGLQGGGPLAPGPRTQPLGRLPTCPALPPDAHSLPLAFTPEGRAPLLGSAHGHSASTPQDHKGGPGLQPQAGRVCQPGARALGPGLSDCPCLL